MPARRILSLWFPHLAAEHWLRLERAALPGPLAVVAQIGNRQVLASLSPEAAAQGLRVDQPLRDALAICPALVTRTADPRREAAFLDHLARWAGRFSPWVAALPPDGLTIDLTGCAHLFGGEAALADQIARACEGFGLTVRMGLADTQGAAWALARFGGRAPGTPRTGDAIRQEARATRSRAAARPGAGAMPEPAGPPTRIAPPGQMRQALSALPVAALRLPPKVVEGLAALGLRRVGDVLGLPRATLARRFGPDLMRRLDQALGLEPEPVSPARPVAPHAVRLSFPEPIARREDILAAIDRLLPALQERLQRQGLGVRRLRLLAYRSDHGVERVEIGLARPSAEPDRLRPLLEMKLEEIDPGLGIDTLRLQAVATEPVAVKQRRAPLGPDERQEAGEQALADLIARLGARIGMEAITRLHPAESHIPERAFLRYAAAWSAPARGWAAPPVPRPLILMNPEPVTTTGEAVPPRAFRWRRRDFTVRQAIGPERIAPEWWLDDPAWRSGPRDYWRIGTDTGQWLWLFRATGAEIGGGWFCQGEFA
ncbi:MAG: DNA polymerase Y family protein [Paracoccaceae bacterium]|nr:DNA polymerase Y family protein [Paracoccaceae bacterium]